MDSLSSENGYQFIAVVCGCRFAGCWGEGALNQSVAINVFLQRCCCGNGFSRTGSMGCIMYTMHPMSIESLSPQSAKWWCGKRLLL